MSRPIQKTLCSTAESSHFFTNTAPYGALQIIPMRSHLAIARYGGKVTCSGLKARAGAWNLMMRETDAHKTLNEYICVEYDFLP